LVYCITEDMVADIFTKIVSGAQDKRVSIRSRNFLVMTGIEVDNVNVVEIYFGLAWSIFRWEVIE
jgi:hypothetical protein